MEDRELCRCPCCQNKTLTHLGVYNICEICDWEDDGQGDEDADVVRGGPNGDLSLTAAREKFLQGRRLKQQLGQDISIYDALIKHLGSMQ